MFVDSNCDDGHCFGAKKRLNRAREKDGKRAVALREWRGVEWLVL